jgi:AbrB family looped-hinge helix DNA binding protein
MPHLTITAKGQVTFRKEVRAHLGVKPGEKVDVRLLPGGRVELSATALDTPAPSFATLAGRIRTPEGRVVTLEDIHSAIESGWSGRL